MFLNTFYYSFLSFLLSYPLFSTSLGQVLVVLGLSDDYPSEHREPLPTSSTEVTDN